MAALNAAEQAYWRKRIARRIDQKVAALLAGDPGFWERLRRQARLRALQSLGLAELQGELDRLAAQQQELAGRRRQLRRALRATVRRVPLTEVAGPADDGPDEEVRRALRQRQAVHEQELLAEDERGREISRLGREKEHLRAAVWLAAAPPAVKALWRQVLALLGEEPTALEQAVLAVGGNDNS